MHIIDHGIEYHIETTNDLEPNVIINCIKLCNEYIQWDDGHFIIANTVKTDKRLIETTYYKNNKDKWFELNATRKQITIKDIHLNDNEKEYLDIVLKELGDKVKNHGWYEVFYYK